MMFIICYIHLVFMSTCSISAGSVWNWSLWNGHSSISALSFPPFLLHSFLPLTKMSCLGNSVISLHSHFSFWPQAALAGAFMSLGCWVGGVVLSRSRFLFFFCPMRRSMTWTPFGFTHSLKECWCWIYFKTIFSLRNC